MSSAFRRIVAGLGANLFAQVITIGMQIAALPIFLRYWSASKYGQWLLISAIPYYFSMADIGMVTAAGHRMTMAMGRNDRLEANRVFQSAFVFMLISCSTLALLGVPAALLVPLQGVGGQDERIAISALVLGILFGLFGGLSEAIFRATGRYGLGTALGNLVRLGEWGGCIAGLVVFGTFSAVALGGLSARIIGTISLIVLSARGDFGIKWGYVGAERHEVLAITRPALAFMLFPLSSAISLQGMTLLAGYEFGPVMVVVFNSYRTLARVVVQATSIISFSLEPEFSRLFGRAGVGGVVGPYQRATLAGIAVAGVLGTLLYFTSPTLLRIWTHGRIAFHPGLMGLMVGYAAVISASYIPRTLLVSTNEHSRLAVWSVTIAAASLVLGAPLSTAWMLEGLVVAMIVAEVGAAVVCWRLAEKLLRVSRCADSVNLLASGKS